MLLHRCAYVVVASFLVLSNLSGAPLITEFVADNETGLQDEDGDFSDWIEIHNLDPDPVSLDGYYLTDSANDLARWRIPDVMLPGGEFLIVFASGKARAVPGSELHTDFRLSAGGEYLALVRPDGLTVEQDFAPEYPPQDPDRSFGLAFEGARLVLEGDSADTFVPVDGSLGNTWTQPAFSPGAGWIPGPTGVGFGLSVPGFTVQETRSTGGIADLATADAVLAGSAVADETTTTSPVVNFLDTGGEGRFENNLLFPNGGGDNFAVRATGTVFLPTGGAWTFGINSDDGARLRIGGANVIVDDNLHGPLDNLATVTLAAGPHDLELVYFELGGGAEVELYAAPGSFGSFGAGAGTFRLIGDIAGGGLEVVTSPEGAAASGGAVQTDIGADMQGVGSSAFVRVPFQVDDLAGLDSLSLGMAYNDGFVAYLNGVEIARRNAPGAVAWDSVATAARDGIDSLVPEQINVTAALPQLVVGANVLAVQGLNVSAADDSFLVLPSLSGGGVGVGDPVFFDAPTPQTINGEPSSLGQVADTRFSPDRGFYPNASVPALPFAVSITSDTEGATIRFTTDGSAPSETTGTVYTGPVMISGTTTLRAIAFRNGFEPTNVDTHTYLVLDDILTQQADGSPPPGWPAGPINDQVLNYGMDPEIVGAADPSVGGVTQVRDALQAIPSLAVSTAVDSLMDGSSGIYTNARNRGLAWERPASIELIFPEGYVDPDGNDDGFQTDCGIRIRGGFSRRPENPKHSFRLFFRRDYGDGKLNYPLFGDEGVSAFDNLDLRGPQNYSWAQSGDSRNSFMRDVWSRDLQREMGNPYKRSRYYHLYLNGVYWGITMTEERAEASFGESYFGGEKEDYDVVKSFGGIADGNRDSYERLWQAWQAGFSADADYFRIQGLNVDGTPNPTFERLLDAENLIDYMLITYYTGDRDGPGSRFTQPNPNNYFGIFSRVAPDGFKFFEHDSEHSLGTGDNDMTFPLTQSTTLTQFNPHTLHEGLTSNLEYRTRFADRAQEVFYNGGLMTSDVGIARVDRRAAQIDSAIYAHSARWGDATRAEPRNRNDWLGAVEGVRSFIRSRVPVVVGQLRDRGWFPSVGAPTFAQHGGYVSSTDPLVMGGEAGATIYFTTGPEDPRLQGGILNGQAAVFEPTDTVFTLVSPGGSWRYLDDGSDQGVAWRQPGFDDGGWKAGLAEFGYGDGGERTELLFGPDPDNTNNDSNAKFITTYFRKTFNVVGANSFTALDAEVLRDDGVVVYLNGNEVFRQNMPGGDISYLTTALGAVGGEDESAFFSEILDPSVLQEGVNTIAVELHQASPTSSDTGFDFRLTGVQTTSTDPVFLSGPGEVMVQARSRTAGGEWSAVNAATFFVDLAPPTAGNLVVSEIHFRPAPPSSAELAAGFNDRDDFEFIELTNVSGEHVHLRDLVFSDGIGFALNDSALGVVVAPGERVVIVRNAAAFAFRYGPGIPIAGEFTGGLNNDGEGVVLEVAASSSPAVAEFVYNDAAPWPIDADGNGYSLVLRDPAADPSDPANWRPSVEVGGSPGGSDRTSFAAWKSANGITDNFSDSDRDGLSAVLEYVTGADPSVPDRGRTIGVEMVEDPASGPGAFPVVSFPRRAGADDVSVVVEVSDGLGGWAAVPLDTEYLGVTKDAGGGEMLRFRHGIPVAAGERRFFRVRANL